MEPISKANFAKSVDPTLSIGRVNENQFAEKLKLAKAAALLRNTAQYEKWIKLCQRNGETANETADLLLRRHDLLEKSKKGEDIDWLVFDEITGRIKNNGISLYESSEIPRQKSVLEKNNPGKIPANNVISEPQSKISQGSAEKLTQPVIDIDKTVNNTDEKQYAISEDDFLLLNVKYKKYILGENVVGYGDTEKLFLPLEQITRILDFNIETDVEKGTAEGWFLSEDRNFALDIKKNEVLVDGKKVIIPKNSISIVDEQIFVDSNLLSKWFPVKYHLDFGTQSVNVTSTEKLPFQARLEREFGYNVFKTNNRDKTIYPREYSKYNFSEMPSVDLNIKTFYTHSDDKESSDNKLKSGFNIYSVGDLGKMSSEIYLAGNTERNITDSQFTFKRITPDANLLGPLKATSVEVGDIKTANVSLPSANTKERGISISNKELFRSRDFDKTFFEGSLPSGWDIELYRNNSLMETMRVGDDGKYYLGDIPIYYGKNDYKLIFYGPQGQKRIETKSINVGSNLLKKGTGEYNISVTQKNTDVYEPAEVRANDKESTKLDATFDYGVNEKISVGMGLSSQEVDSDRHNLIDLNVKGNYKNVRLKGDYINDDKGGSALLGLAQARLGKVNLNLQHKNYNNLLSNDYFQTDLATSGVIKGNGSMPDIIASLLLRDTQRKNSHDNIIGSSIAANTKHLSLSNYLEWKNRTDSSNDFTSMDGNLMVSGQIDKLQLGGRLDYKIKPDDGLKKAQINSSYQIAGNLTSSLSVTKNIEDDGDYEGSLGLNWNRDNGNFVVSPGVSYNSDDKLTARLNFSTSLGPNPKTKKIKALSESFGQNGTALIRVYNDKNNNSIFDNDDELIKNALIKGVQSGGTSKTDEDGLAVLDRLIKYKPTDIYLDTDSVEDPFLEPEKGGVSIISRPGHIQEIDIPVIGTGEIDGTVYLELKDGTEEPYTNTKMQLIDEKGNVLQEIRSEYDGFYVFTKVPHGKYSVRIDPEQLEKKGMDAKTLSDLNIISDDNILSGNDIILVASAKEKISVVEEEAQIADVLEKSPAVEKETAETEPLVEKTVAEIPIEKAEPKAPLNIAKTDKTVDDTGSVVDDSDDSLLGGGIAIEKTKEPEPEKPIYNAEVEDVLKNEKFGLHLTSYRTSEKAIAGIDYLRKKYKDILGGADFTVKKVHVSDEKGTWFRVFAGTFNSEEKAEKMKKQIKMSLPYCRVIQLETGEKNEAKAGVHLTSFRTTAKARLSIQELKDQYPVILRDVIFSIKSVDLGPEKGKWKRVIAGNFSKASDAKLLAKRIKMSSPYGETMRIEKNEEFGIHLASFKTSGKASRGLGLLQKKFRSTLNNDDFSIRRVDLGAEKGIWYRIFSGRFEDKESASPIINSLKNMNQYARVMNISDHNLQKL